MCHVWCVCVFFKQKTAYYMRISDWSSDVCSSDLGYHRAGGVPAVIGELIRAGKINTGAMTVAGKTMGELHSGSVASDRRVIRPYDDPLMAEAGRSEEHTSELQSLMRNSYAVFCLKKKTTNQNTQRKTTDSYTKE